MIFIPARLALSRLDWNIFCFFIALMFSLVVNIYLKHKITLIIKMYCSMCFSFMVLSVFAPPSFLFDLLRTWQSTLPLVSGYLTYLSIKGLRINKKLEKPILHHRIIGKESR